MNVMEQKGINPNKPKSIKYTIVKNGKWKCWHCTSHKAIDSSGYTIKKRHGRFHALHRLMYIDKYGEIPEGMVIMHKCDNVKCINPNHLTSGTHQENMDDMVKKGRGRTNKPKFSENNINDMRANLENLSMSKLALKYNISTRTLRDIRNNRNRTMDTGIDNRKIPRRKSIEYDINENDCHICTSHSRDRNGYARIIYNGVKIGVHKMLYLQRHGEDSIPKDNVLMHKCDNPNCINVDHLTSGTHQENMKDMKEKGRAKGNKRKRLTKEEVRFILENVENLIVCELAKKFDVNPRTIQSVRNRDKRKREAESKGEL